MTGHGAAQGPVAGPFYAPGAALQQQHQYPVGQETVHPAAEYLNGLRRVQELYLPTTQAQRNTQAALEALLRAPGPGGQQGPPHVGAAGRAATPPSLGPEALLDTECGRGLGSSRGLDIPESLSLPGECGVFDVCERLRVTRASAGHPPGPVPRRGRAAGSGTAARPKPQQALRAASPRSPGACRATAPMSGQACPPAGAPPPPTLPSHPCRGGPGPGALPRSSRPAFSQARGPCKLPSSGLSPTTSLPILLLVYGAEEALPRATPVRAPIGPLLTFWIVFD